jgi:hypothetical protein
MKKLYTNMLMLIAIIALTSCDQDMLDRSEARTLDGTWSGYIDTYYADRWGLNDNSFRTTIYFERENPYGGWGYEVDYNYYSRYNDYYYCEFRWKVVNGSIYISYADSSNDVIIYDYHLTDNYFDGYMDDGTHKEIHFRLDYDSSFDWNYWRTRGATRSGGDTQKVQASGVFAKGQESN